MAIENITLEDAEDPLGNGQGSKQIVYDDGSGPVRSGLYICVHGGGPNNFRIVSGAPSPSDKAPTIYELAPDGRVTIVKT